MKIYQEKLQQLTDELCGCQNTLQALGDETRQHLILGMMQIRAPEARVGDITARVNLSRPSVSHHLKILREAGLVTVRKEGTKNYYSFDPDMEAIKALSQALDHVMELMGVTMERQSLS